MPTCGRASALRLRIRSSRERLEHRPRTLHLGVRFRPVPGLRLAARALPVHWTKLPSGVEAWLVTRYADARQALADQRLSKNPDHHAGDAQGKSRTGIPGERSANLMTHLLNIDPRITPGCAASSPRRSPRVVWRNSSPGYRS